MRSAVLSAELALCAEYVFGDLRVVKAISMMAAKPEISPASTIAILQMTVRPGYLPLVLWRVG